MAGFNKLLLCVTEGDDAAVQHVARLAAATGADLTISDVIEDILQLRADSFPAAGTSPLSSERRSRPA